MASTNGKLEAQITIPAGGWDIAVVETGGGGASDTVTIPAGTYYWSSPNSVEFHTVIEGYFNSATLNAAYSCSISAGENGTGKVTITASGGSVTAVALTWTDTELRDLCGFTGNVSGSLSYTSTNHAQALWLPNYGWQGRHGDASFTGHPISDKQDMVNSAGYYFGVAGQTRYESALTWPMCADAKTNTISESTTNESFQTFLEDGIHAGKSWATVGGPIRFYADADTDTTYTTWSVPGMAEYSPQRIRDQWDGYWRIELPRLVKVPS